MSSHIAGRSKKKGNLTNHSASFTIPTPPLLLTRSPKPISPKKTFFSCSLTNLARVPSPTPPDLIRFRSRSASSTFNRSASSVSSSTSRSDLESWMACAAACICASLAARASDCFDDVTGAFLGGEGERRGRECGNGRGSWSCLGERAWLGCGNCRRGGDSCLGLRSRPRSR